MNFIEFAEKVIKEENKPLTQYEIWEIGKSKSYFSQINSDGKTPWQSIGARIYVDIRDNKKSKFIKLKLKPTKFFLKELAKNIDIEKIESSDAEQSLNQSKYKERDLHKYLSYFVHTNNSIYTKTIFHEESNKRTYAQWLHPDMVGVYFPIEEWEGEVLDISKEIGNVSIKLYSYELKRELNFSNLREYYFQAVSNSSWANMGYLVAADIDDDIEFQQEIKRLTNSFGIGIIQLDIANPDLSSIMYPAKEKDFVDIETINKIAKINPNFKDFLKRVKSDLNSREIRKEKYDKIYNIEDILNQKGVFI